MPRLVLLNGPPGCGKSTLARRYAEQHPLTLALDVDQVRAMIGGWREQPVPAGFAARAMAVEMARAHLAGGHDVLVPQYLGRPDFVLALESLAAVCAVPFVELVLMDDRERSIARYLQRGGEESVEALGELYDRLGVLLAGRPGAIVIATRADEIDAAYRALCAALAED